MTKPEIINKIALQIVDKKTSRVYFKNALRSPMFGRFVVCADHNTLDIKGMIRFVSDSKAEVFDNLTNERLRQDQTKIFTLDEIDIVKLF